MNLLLIDDHAMLRDALAGMLREAMPDTQVRVADSGAEGLALAEQSEPDYVFLDYNMPGLNGLETAQRLLERHPYLSIICLSVRTDQSIVQDLFAVGVHAYVLKDDDFSTLIEAFRAVEAGQRYLSPTLQGLVDMPTIENSKPKNRFGYSGLTDRQRDVLALIASGLSTREISEETGLSTKTLDSHRRRIQQRLGVDSIAELTRIAIREGLVALEDGEVLFGKAKTNVNAMAIAK
jgi:two-component system NarL family response regulator